MLLALGSAPEVWSGTDVASIAHSEVAIERGDLAAAEGMLQSVLQVNPTNEVRQTFSGRERYELAA